VVLETQKRNTQELVKWGLWQLSGRGNCKKTLTGDPVLRTKSSAIAKGLMNYIPECQPKLCCQNVHFILVKAGKKHASIFSIFKTGKQWILRVKRFLN